MRKRISYANVTATVALLLTMSGAALAAHHYLISSTKQVKPSLIKILKARTGPAGPLGAPGRTGKEGAAGREGPQGKEAAPPPVVFHALVLENSWVDYEAGGGSYGVPGYTKDAAGVVHLTGAVDGFSATEERLATLPVGFRPMNERIWLRAAATNGEADPHLVDIEVRSNGEVLGFRGPGATAEFVSLEGLSFDS